ncbi:MAG TPA: hypothetical protein DD473_19700 [Planctomycetaceae bacterium]|nr:hypothetical protein [Planctomycetaceae bacterium]
MSNPLSNEVASKMSAPPDISQGQSWYEYLKSSIQDFFNWILNWSFASKVAWAVFGVLILIVAVFWTLLWNQNNVPWIDSLSVERFETVALVLIIPLMVYRLVGAWTTGVESQQPDIRAAWDRGMKDLKNAGISVESVPIYLVVGSSGQRLERRIMEGLESNFLVSPDGLDNYPIHWYADRNAIYLYCTDCSWTNEIADRIDNLGALHPGIDLERPADQRGGKAFSKNSLEMRMRPKSRAQGNATVDLDDYDDMQNYESVSEESFEASIGTLRSDSVHIDQSATTILTAEESMHQLQRLSYVCRLIQSVRDPLCPINGILTLSPFLILERSRAEVEQYHRAMRADLLTIQQTLMLKAPVIAMFFGMEKLRGFQELTRRIGKKGAEARRFGMGFELRAAATVTELQQYSLHVTGVFEDWIYKLFCDKDALTHPGNNLLYELLSTIRTRLKSHLSNFLSLGFGHDSKDKNQDDLIRFGGCYFASTGTKPDERAFLRAVFAKLESLQEEVEWTSVAIKRQSKFSFSIIIAGTLILASVVAMGAMLYFNR